MSNLFSFLVSFVSLLFVCSSQPGPIIEENVVGNYVAVLTTRVLNWDDSNEFCLSEYGTTLATITNMYENEDAFLALSGLTMGNTFGWIGLYDISNDDSDFEWIDGTVFDESLSFNAISPNIDGGNDNCFYMNVIGQWDDAFCTNVGGGSIICNLDSDDTLAPTEEPAPMPRKRRKGGKKGKE